MSHKQKLQKYRIQIRNKEINQIIAQKRIWRDFDTQNCRLIPQLQPVNLTLLMQIAKVAQFQQNIQPLHRLGWHKHLAIYLSPEYNFTAHQCLAASALCNIMNAQDFQQPSQKMTQNILRILDRNITEKVLDSILILIYNIAHDNKAWFDSLIFNHNLIEKIVSLFNLQSINHSIIYSLLLIDCKILSVSKFSPQFFKIAEPIFNLINTNLALDPGFFKMTIYCLCQLSKKFPEKISIKLQEIGFFKKVGRIIKILQDKKIISNYITLLSRIVQHLQCQTFEALILPLLCQKIYICDLKIKEKMVQLIYYALQQKKLDLQLFWNSQVSCKLLQMFENVDNTNILYQLCYVFCLCLLNLKKRKMQTQNLIDLIKRKRILLNQKVDIQGLIDETLQLYQKEIIYDIME